MGRRLPAPHLERNELRRELVASQAALPNRRSFDVPLVCQRLATLTDPRHRRGKRHTFVSALLSPARPEPARSRRVGQWTRRTPSPGSAYNTCLFHVRIARMRRPSAAS